MIASLNGILRAKNPTDVIVDVEGIGYSISIPLSTYEKLGEIDTRVKLLTYLHVREDMLQLFGFATEDERSLFKHLISVSGIGPKIAQGILSGVTVNELRSLIVSGNVGSLQSIPNIGKKTAERLVVELRDKLSKGIPSLDTAGPTSPENTQIRADALHALTSLGFTRTNAEKALRSVIGNPENKNLSLEEIIKKALRQISSK